MKISKKEGLKSIKIIHNKTLFWIIVILFIFLCFSVYNLIKLQNEKSAASDQFYCNVDSDCHPDSCCHASSCINAQVSCKNIKCTQECKPNTLDCGQGSCACSSGKCVTNLK